jgi:undecaprenyl phosphate-alpha-L-ara4N flippase subunit ArnE
VTGYGLLALACLLTCAGQLCQKQAAETWLRLGPRPDDLPSVLRPKRLFATARWLGLAALLLGLGLLVWLGVLRRLPVSLAYPMLSFNFVLVVLAARFIFHEPVPLRHWCGVMVIVCGIILLGASA